MKIDPATHYDNAYWSAQKPYRVALPDGTIETRQYQGPALWWDGFGPLSKALVAAVGATPGARWFDIGCGAGCLVSFLVDQGIDAFGMDISDHAVAHVRARDHERITVGDVTSPTTASETFASRVMRVPKSFAFVSATDLVEHIYLKDQPQLWETFDKLLAPGGALVLDVATAYHPGDEWEMQPGDEVPIEREWQSVTGHVCVKRPQFWYGWAAALGWRLDRSAMDRFETWRMATPGYDKLIAWGPDNFMVFRR